MTNWLDDPAVKALLPHGKLIEEAFGLTEAEIEASTAFNRKDWSVRRQSPGALARKSHRRTSSTRTAKTAV